MTDPSTSLKSARAAGWMSALAIAATFIALFAWTWGTWPDVLVDFGRELYVPWQLTQGKSLYTDIAYFNGPLSPHINALAFRFFGVGLSTLVWLNAALFAAILALLHYIVRSISSPFAATAACIVVMCCCGFGQLVGIGNYNYICPYSHEATHGMLFGLATLAVLQRWRSAQWAAFAAGSCVGLAFLTKPEMFIAALVAASTALVLHAWSARGRRLRSVLLFALGAATPIVISFALLARWQTSAVAWHGTLGAWPALVSSDVTQSKFYRSGSGLDAPAANTLAMFVSAAGLIALLSPSVLLARIARGSRRAHVAKIAAILVTGGALAWLYTRLHWSEAARPWPLFSLAALVGALTLLRHQRANARLIGAASFALFAFTLLAKMALNARLVHYGFALAMPATALIVVALIDWIPRWSSQRGDHGQVVRACAIVICGFFAAIHLALSARMLSRKHESVGALNDRFRADARGQFVNAALAWIAERYPAGVERPTLAVLPEGVTLNYLARLDNPTPYINFMPPEVSFFGGARMLDAFRAHSPDVVMLVQKDTSEYGVSGFGIEYGRELCTWLVANYDLAQLFGAQPLSAGSKFGIAVLVRKPTKS